MQTHLLASHERRKLRRIIGCAMATAALGAGLFTVPALATTYTVSNTADSGAGSLRQAILDANGDGTQSSIIFSSSLGSNPSFTLDSPLPVVTNPHGVVFGANDTGINTIPQTLIGNNGNNLVLSATNIGGNAEADGSTHFYLDEYAGNSSSITGNATANDSGWFLLDANSYITGNATANDNGEFWFSGNNYIGGNATANDNSTFTLAGTGYIGGNATANGNGTFNLVNTYIGGDATANDNGVFNLHNSSYIVGNATANGNGVFNLTTNNYIGGNAVANNNAVFNLDETSYITGNATANGESSFILNSSNNIGGNATANDEASFTLYGSSSVTGDATANGSASFTLYGTANIGGNATINDSASFTQYGDSSITGDATANGYGLFTLYSNGSIGGNATANQAGEFVLYNSHSITGNATATGDAGNDDWAGFELYNTSSIGGNAVANTNGYFELYDNSNIVGNATFNDNSWLSTGESPTIQGGLSFGSNAIFNPLLDGETTLDINGTVTPGNAKIVPWWDNYPPQSVFNVGDSYTVLHSDHTITGEFDPTVVSPLPFDVTYGDGSDVILTISGDKPFDFGYVPGTQNEHALGNYLNGFVTTSEGVINLSDAPLDLPQFVYDVGSSGDLSELTYYTGDTYTSFGAQNYWNQKNFIDSIADELRNENNAQEGAASFALNASGGGNVQGQLNSLSQMMNAPAHGLGFESGQSAQSGIWATMSKSHLSTDSDDSIGSPQWDSSNQAESVGYTGGGDAFRWGVAAGHQKSDLSFGNRDADGEMEGYNAGLYASWKGKSTYLNTILGYSNFDNDLTSFDEDDATTSFNSHGLSAYLELGKHLREDKSSGLTPYGSLLWTRSSHGDIDTAGEDLDQQEPAPTLTVLSGSNTTLTSQLGMRFNHHTVGADGRTNGGWQAGLSWLHQFDSTGFPVTGTYGDPLVDGAPTSFTVNGTPLSSNALQVELGAYGRIHGSLIGFAGYRGIFSSDQKENSVTAGVGYQF